VDGAENVDLSRELARELRAVATALDDLDSGELPESIMRTVVAQRTDQRRTPGLDHAARILRERARELDGD